MMNLMHALLRARVRPYYLYMADQVAGGEHFRTTVQKGLEIIQALRGWTSGLAVPHFVIDSPGGGGKDLASCMGFWDRATHMSKPEWRAACLRTMDEYPSVTR